MEIIVAPISGGHFLSQTMAYKILMYHIDKPKLILTGSGGSVASYVAMGSGWKPNMMDFVVNRLHSAIFVKPNEDKLISIVPPQLMVLFSESVYELGTGAPEFLEEFFSEETIQNIEIWSCAINRDSGKAGLFCNKKRRESIIRADNYNMSIFDTENLKYMCGNISHISNAILASSSVPIFVEPAKIGDNYYIDSGAMFASALTPLQDEIIQATMDGVHFIYLSPYDTTKPSRIRKPEGEEPCGLIGTGLTVMSHVTRGLVQQDKAVAHKIVASHAENNQPPYRGKAHISCLGGLLDGRRMVKASLIEIYPRKGKIVNIFKLKRGALSKIMNTITLKVRIWWVGDRNLFCDLDGFTYVENH